MHPCLLGFEPINGEEAMIMAIQQDRGVLKELEKAEAEDAKKRIVKQKDPANTSRAQEELEAEGKSVVENKSVNMNADKVSGQGTLKVRFQVTNPERKSFSEKKNTTANNLN